MPEKDCQQQGVRVVLLVFCCRYNVADQEIELPLPAGSLAFSLCQVPVVFTLVFTLADRCHLLIKHTNQPREQRADLRLSRVESQSIFLREGLIDCIQVLLDRTQMRGRSVDGDD